MARKITHYNLVDIDGRQVLVPTFQVEEGQLWEGRDPNTFVLFWNGIETVFRGKLSVFTERFLRYREYHGRRARPKKEHKTCSTLVRFRH